MPHGPEHFNAHNGDYAPPHAYPDRSEDRVSLTDSQRLALRIVSAHYAAGARRYSQEAGPEFADGRALASLARRGFLVRHEARPPFTVPAYTLTRSGEEAAHMPDTYGFDHLGTQAPTVSCIEQGCDARGPLHEWPERARKAHARKHRSARAEREAEQKRFAAQLRAAANANTEQEEESMAKQTGTTTAKPKKAAAAKPKRTKAECERTMKEHRDGYIAYERAHAALKKAEAAGDSAAAEIASTIKGENKDAHAKYWSAYEALRAIKKAQASDEVPVEEAPAEAPKEAEAAA